MKTDFLTILCTPVHVSDHFDIPSFSCSTNELSLPEPMDTGKPPERATSKKYVSTSAKCVFLLSIYKKVASKECRQCLGKETSSVNDDALQNQNAVQVALDLKSDGHIVKLSC